MNQAPLASKEIAISPDACSIHFHSKHEKMSALHHAVTQLDLKMALAFMYLFFSLTTKLTSPIKQAEYWLICQGYWKGALNTKDL